MKLSFSNFVLVDLVFTFSCIGLTLIESRLILGQYFAKLLVVLFVLYYFSRKGVDKRYIGILGILIAYFVIRIPFSDNYVLLDMVIVVYNLMIILFVSRYFSGVSNERRKNIFVMLTCGLTFWYILEQFFPGLKSFKSLDLSWFGLSDVEGSTVIFKLPHQASQYFAFGVVLSYVLINKWRGNLLVIVVFLLNLSFLWFTLVRTGIFSALGALLCFGKIRAKIFVVSLSLILGYLSFLYLDGFSERILGIREGQVRFSGDFNALSSGRLGYWTDYIQFILGGDLSSALFGQSYSSLVQYLSSIYGRFLIPHNFFIEVLAFHGVIGFLLIVYAYYYILLSFRCENKYKLMIIVCCGLYMFLQGAVGGVLVSVVMACFPTYNRSAQSHLR